MKLLLKLSLLLSLFVGLTVGRTAGLLQELREKSGGDSGKASAAPSIAAYDEPQKIGEITNASLTELSGITHSRTGRGLWWVHNDSGDQARIYVINTKGTLLGRFAVTGARNRDWEDLAIGPGRDGKPALYIADIGDNNRRRDDLTLYRVKEPDLSKGVKSGETEAAEAFRFRYPDGHHDAEALLVDPKSGRPYIVTKTFAPPCGVYRFPLPLDPNKKVTLEKVSGRGAEQLSQLMLVTGGAASPDGQRAVVRTYLGAYELVRTKQGGFESLFDAMPVPVRLAPEKQGEAICYAPDGKSILTTSEQIPAPIYQIKRLGGPGQIRRPR